MRFNYLFKALFFLISIAVLPLRANTALQEFTFNPLSVERDPFGPPEIQAEVEEDALLRFDLLEIKLVAIMTGLGAPKAMVVLPNGESHILQEGDRIGKNKGYISKIKKNEVAVIESFKDFRGRIKKNYEKLTID